ncbi:MAG: type ISP restriction/modification enzyme [Pirellulaceae bacterium]
MAEHPLQPLVRLTRRLQEAVEEVLASAHAPWPALWAQFVQRTGEPSPANFADAVAQSIACGLYAVTSRANRLPPKARSWLLAQADPLLESVLRPCLCARVTAQPADALERATREIASYLAECPGQVRGGRRDADDDVPDPWIYFFEEFLGQYSAQSRRRQGVYYTPPELASYLVRSIDQTLQTELALADGLADRSTWHHVRQTMGAAPASAIDHSKATFVRVLDPAMGTGVFLLAVFDHLRTWWIAHHSTYTQDDWSAFVNSTVLPRLYGQELILPAVVLSQLLMTARLAESGHNFQQQAKLGLYLGNTLSQPRIGDTSLVNAAHPYTVVLGNPPFCGVSDNHDPWVRQLLRGHAPGNSPQVASYFQIDGQPLGERKHWLEDDYVKFVRLAHWIIETAGAGVVGFVTNHGFLDNVTFRGMRQQLLNTFSRITVVDLHGNSRTGERSPDGRPDESLFGIEQGVAVTLFCRPVRLDGTSQVDQVDLWGRRREKLQTLAQSPPLPLTRLEPSAPNYFLVPHDRHGESEYARGYRLPDIMPVNSTAAVTARDSFVVAFSQADLEERIAVLADSRVSDDEIRRRFFTTSRSTKYLPGDTRGWRLAEARQRIAREPHWRRWIRDCLYRPFDRRKIWWIPWMIDWPREAVMAHLTGGRNVAFVARRQGPSSQPANYFWVTDTIALDGLVRSDNRGSESVFPLYLMDNRLMDDSGRGHDNHVLNASRGHDPPSHFRPNFSMEFVEQFAHHLSLTWHVDVSGAGESRQFTPWELFCYVYALFHAPSYRQRFATWLRIDFPRVFVPAHRALFRSLSRLGARLIARHLLQGDPPARLMIEGASPGARVGAGFPKWAAGRVCISRNLSIGPLPRHVWEFRVGTHQVCRKWLKDRRERELLPADLTHYSHILAALIDTFACMQQVDQEIDRHGGWTAAFR